MIVRIDYDMLPQGREGGGASMYNSDCRREFVAVKHLFLANYRDKGFTSAITANHKL